MGVRNPTSNGITPLQKQVAIDEITISPLSWEGIVTDRALGDQAILTFNFDLYMSKVHKHILVQISVSIYSSIFNLFKMAAKNGKYDFKSSSNT